MKKTISILLSLAMLLSFAPMSFADGEGETTTTTIQLSETATVVVGEKSKGTAGDYDLSDCESEGPSGATFLSTKSDQDDYKVNNRYIIFKINAPVAGAYRLTSVFRGDVGSQSVYLDDCLVKTSTSTGNYSRTTPVELAKLQLTQGVHTLFVYFAGGATEYVRNFQFTKIGDMEKITLAANHRTTVEGTANVSDQWSSSTKTPDQVSAKYGTSTLATANGAQIYYDVNVPVTGNYQLSGDFSLSNANEGTVQIGIKAATADEVTWGATFNLDSKAYKSYTFDTLVPLNAGEQKIYFKFGSTYDSTTGAGWSGVNAKNITLEQLADSSVLDNINSATDGVAIKDIIKGASGKYINDMKYDMSKLFMPEFVTKALASRNSFATLEEVKTAFDTAYATESASPSVQLIKQVGANNTPVANVAVGATYKIKVKADLLAENSAVLFCKYSDANHSKLTNVIAATAVKGQDVETTVLNTTYNLNLGFWVNPGENFEVFFLNNLNDLQPIPLFQ